MNWTAGDIDGVIVRRMQQHRDARGWLAETFRSDEVGPELMPRMGYVSVTHAGVTRGPHEHLRQTDMFSFAGPGRFLIKLWDNREGSPTRGNTMDIMVGEDNPAIIIVPPRIVHAYRNVSTTDAWVANYPNRLFAGEGRTEEVDEIRYENVPGHGYDMPDTTQGETL